MRLRTKSEQKAYLDGYKMCAECIENYLSDEDKIKLECLLSAVRNAVEIEGITEENKGEWKRISPAGIYECSECGQNVMTSDIECYKFCHGCGAMMKGDK